MCGVGKLLGGVAQPVRNDAVHIIGQQSGQAGLEAARHDFTGRLGLLQHLEEGLLEQRLAGELLTQQQRGRALHHAARQTHKFAVGQQTFQQTLDHQLQALLQRKFVLSLRLVGLRHCVCNCLLKVGGYQFLLGREVFVDGGITHVGGTRDLLHRGALKPMLGHQVHCGLNDQPMVFGLLGFGSTHDRNLKKSGMSGRGKKIKSGPTM